MKDDDAQDAPKGGSDSGRSPAKIVGSARPTSQPEARETKPTQEGEKSESIFRRIETYCAVLLVLITGAYTIVAKSTLDSIQAQTKAASDAAAKALQEQRRESASSEADFVKQFKASNMAVTKQLAGLETSIKIASRQADASARQADANGRQALIAAGNLKETGTALAVTQANFFAEQRPYLSVDIPQIAPDSSGGYMYTAGVNVGNYGRSAAENVTIAWNVSHSVSGHASKEADAFP